MNELRWILKSLGDDLTEEEIDDMIADVDTDGSGWVDYDGMSLHNIYTLITIVIVVLDVVVSNNVSSVLHVKLLTSAYGEKNLHDVITSS